MMKLDLMQSVVATVDDEWHSLLADEVIARWAHDAGKVWYWRASANFLFKYELAGKLYALRFNHESERSAEAIQAEVDCVRALAERGVPVAKPVASLAGNLVERVPTALGVFYAVAFEWLAGEQMEIDDLSPAMVEQWGATLGKLHAASAQLTIQDAHVAARPSWADHLAAIEAALPPQERDAQQLLANLQSDLQQLPITAQNFGLIHFDFELDNLLWHEGQFGIVDFDDCARYWFVADIAFALRDLFEDNAAAVDLASEAVQHFVRGYRMQKPIDDTQLALIPLFL